MFTVIVREKGGVRQSLDFDEDSIAIGRVQGNEIVLPGGNVSKRHAKVEMRNGQYLISDSGSTNGTYVNGRRIVKPTPLTAGDKVYIGNYIVSLDKIGSQGSGPAVGISGTAASPKDTLEDLDPVYDSSAQVISFLDNSHSPTAPDGRSDPDDAPRGKSLRMKRETASGRAPTISLASDKNTPDPVNPTEYHLTSSDSIGPGTKIDGFVERIIDHVAREIKRVDRAVVPVKLDPGIAGQVRIIIDDVVADFVSRGRLPEEIDPHVLRGTAYRATVDLGPLEAWLKDEEIKMIRMPGPGSAFLFKDGKWAEATDNFLTPNDMKRAIRCLGSGLPSLDGSINGLSWYRTEEGYRVFAATLKSGNSGPSVFLDKTSAPNQARTEATLPKKAMGAVQKAIDKPGNVAVIGSSAAVRMSVLECLADLLPVDEYAVAIEKMSFLTRPSRRKTTINAQNQSENSQVQGGMAVFWDHALALEPDWVVAGGIEANDAPHVLRAAAGRSGVLSELPVCSLANLEQELGVAMAAAGAPVSSDATGRLMNDAFRFVVTATRNENGFSEVGGVYESSLSLKGRFETKKLYDRALK